MNKQKILINISTILFWIICTFILKQFMKSEYVLIYPLVGCMINFCLFFFKPLATWITGLIKNRKIWIYISILLLIIAMSVMTFNHDNKTTVMIFIGILIAIAQASQSLFYLLYNEQIFKRKESLKSSYEIGQLVLFGMIIGILLFYFQTTKNLNIKIFYIAFIILLILEIIILFFIKEHKENFGLIRKDFTQKEFKDSKILSVIIVSFCLIIGITTSLIQTNQIIDSKTNVVNKDFYSIAFLSASALFSRFFYKYIILKFDQIKVLLILISLLTISTIAISNTNNKIVDLILMIIVGFLFYQTFFFFFGYAIMLNYRIKNRPITGFAAGFLTIGIFIVQFTFTILTKENYVISHSVYAIVESIISLLNIVVIIIILIKRKTIFNLTNNQKLVNDFKNTK